MSRGLEVLVARSPAYGVRGSEIFNPLEGRKLCCSRDSHCGQGGGRDPDPGGRECRGDSPLPGEWAKGEEVFLLKVKGDSMAPFILPDDYVIVRAQPSAENGDVVVTLVGRRLR